MKKHFSKIFAMLLVVSMAVTQLMMPVNAVEPCEEGAHSWKLVNTISPTCNSEGYDEFVCEICGEEMEDNFVSPTGEHDYENFEGKPVTCTEDGWDPYGVCKNCGYSTQVIIHSTGHSYTYQVIAPTCTDNGWTMVKCSKCDYLDYTDKKDATGHTPKAAVYENYVDSTCEELGSVDKVVYCDSCNLELSRKQEPIAAKGHDWVVTDSIDATCTANGFIDYKCSRCGDTKREILLSEGAHKFYEVIASSPATCTEPGTETLKCSLCDYTIDKKVAEPLGHNVVTDEAVAVTCGTDGLTEGSHCDRCGEVFVAQEVIPKLGHNWVAGEPVAPTCSAEGYTIYTCSNCAQFYKGDIVPIDPTAHNRVVTKAGVPATCVSEGYSKEMTCSICGKVTTASHVIPKNPDGHNFVANVVAPTCTANGYTEYTCSLCNDPSVSYIDPESIVESYGGHDLVHHDAKDATCTEIGWDAYDTCTRCDYTTYKEIAAIGHNYVPFVTDPTCTEHGYTTHVCSKCGDSYVDSYVDATGHNDTETLGIVQPTCTDKGYTYKKCLTCGEQFETDYVDELGHDIVHHDAKEATCTESGWDAYDTCTRCDYTTYVEIPALGHDIVHHDAKEATCTEDGYDAYDTCARCDYETEHETYAASGHDIVHHDAKEATCTEAGWDEYETCSKCDYSTYVEISALGHGIVHHDAKEATCTEDGYDAYDTCTRCDYETEHATYKSYNGHDPVIDPAVAATYDETGLTEGSHCARCGEILVAQEETDRLHEDVTFTYEATGINGSEYAVNSGYVYLNVYMNVNSDIARINGIDLGIKYSDSLSLVSADGCVLEQGECSPAVSNLTHEAVLTQDMAFGKYKTFVNGQYLVSTLTFRVAKDFYYNNADFEIVLEDCNIARECANALDVDYGTGTQVNIRMLGDADGNGKINSTDTMMLSQWCAAAGEDDYDTVFDMNKDGYIDGDDLALMRGAAARINDYLDL